MQLDELHLSPLSLLPHLPNTHHYFCETKNPPPPLASRVSFKRGQAAPSPCDLGLPPPPLGYAKNSILHVNQFKLLMTQQTVRLLGSWKKLSPLKARVRGCSFHSSPPPIPPTHHVALLDVINLLHLLCG